MKHLSNILPLFTEGARLCGMLYNLNVIQLIVDIMVAMILALQRDLHVLHHSHGRIVANCSYLGGSVPTFDIKKYCSLSFFNGSVPFLMKT